MQFAMHSIKTDSQKSVSSVFEYRTLQERESATWGAVCECVQQIAIQKQSGSLHIGCIASDGQKLARTVCVCGHFCFLRSFHFSLCEPRPIRNPTRNGDTHSGNKIINQLLFNNNNQILFKLPPRKPDKNA